MSSKNLTCRNCGKKASKVINTHWNNNGQYDHLFDENFNYLGNEVVTKIHISSSYSTSSIHDGRTLDKGKEKVAYFNTWDGETYELKYGKFCTLRCGLEFANKVLNKYDIPEGEL